MSEIQESIDRLKEALQFKGDAGAYANNMMDVVGTVIKELESISR